MSQCSGQEAHDSLCSSLLSKCAETQNLALAEAIVSDLTLRGRQSLMMYKTIMKVYAVGGFYEKACDLYDEIQASSIEPDDVMYACLVKFAVKCGRSDLSKSLFEKAAVAQRHLTNVIITHHSTDTLTPRCAMNDAVSH